MRQCGAVLRPGAVGIGGVVLAVLVSACGTAAPAGSAQRLGTPPPGGFAGTGVSPTGSSGTGTTAPTSGPQGAVARTVLTAYQDWWNAKIQAFGRSDSDAAQLSILSVGQALSDSLASLHQLHDAKLVMIGSPRISPVVTRLDLTANPPTATVEDCLDVSDWHQADASSRAIKDPPRRLSRYPSTTELRVSGNSWIVVEVDREVGRTC